MPALTPSPRPWYDRPLSLGTVARIPVAVSTSWVLITLGMIAVFAPQVRRLLPWLEWPGAAGVALLYTLILAISVLLHEVAHALAARAVGWSDPSIEITLWGGHTSFEANDPRPGHSLLVSIVGPLVNLVLGGVGFMLQRAWDPSGVPELLLYMAVFSNLAVGVFNLLPGLPLDGGRVVEAIAWRATGSQSRGTIAAGWAGRGVVVAVVVGFIAWLLATRAEPGLLTFAILGLVLIPLWTGAGAAIQHGRLRQRLEGMRAHDLLSPAALLSLDATAAQAEAAGVLRGTVVVGFGPGRAMLRVLPEAVVAVPPELRAHTPLSQVGTAAHDAAIVPPGADGDVLAQAALASSSGTVLVVDEGGRCLGAVLREDVIAAIEGRARKEHQQ